MLAAIHPYIYPSWALFTSQGRISTLAVAAVAVIANTAMRYYSNFKQYSASEANRWFREFNLSHTITFGVLGLFYQELFPLLLIPASLYIYCWIKPWQPAQNFTPDRLF